MRMHIIFAEFFLDAAIKWDVCIYAPMRSESWLKREKEYFWFHVKLFIRKGVTMTNNKVDWHERRNIFYNDEEQKNIVTKKFKNDSDDSFIQEWCQFTCVYFAFILLLYTWTISSFLHSVFAMFDFDSKGTFENVVKNSKQIHIH